MARAGPHSALQDANLFEQAALRRTHLDLPEMPPLPLELLPHIWANGYSAGYYAYLWTEMLDDDAFSWFEENGGLTRARRPLPRP